MWTDRQRHPATDGIPPLTLALQAEDRRAARERVTDPGEAVVREELARRMARKIVGIACQRELVVVGGGAELERVCVDLLVENWLMKWEGIV